MNTEYEGRILEVDVAKLKEKLQELGAVYKGDYFQKRYVYDVKPVQKGRWIRLRSNGEEVALTMKDIKTPFIDGTKELEIKVSDFDKCNEFLEELGYIHRNYQENRRVQYVYKGVEIDIDSWPLIPTYVEIEGPSSKAVMDMVHLLGYDEKDFCTLSVTEVYEKYGIDCNSIEVLKLEEERK